MPELPEVEIIRTQLADFIQEKIVKDIIVKDKRYLTPKSIRRWQAIIGLRIHCLKRKGKWLLFDLKDLKIAIHLRLTGNLIFNGKDENAQIVIIFEDGNKLSYYDQRKFGEWWLVRNFEDIPYVAKLGVDPLNDNWDKEKLFSLLRKRNTTIRNFLLDQRNIAGLGNIYVSEALFRAKINPFRMTNRLNYNEVAKLYRAIMETLKLALEAGGSSIRNYKDAQGRKGSFSLQHKVYRREGKRCLRCGDIIKRLKLSSRSCYFCPNCQK